MWSDEFISHLFPSDFDSYEVYLHHTEYIPSMREENWSFLSRVTELNIAAESEVELDLLYFSSLRRLTIDCSIHRQSSAWQTLKCPSLECLALLGVDQDIMQIQYPISAKRVDVEVYCWQTEEELVVAKLFPDVVHLLIEVDEIGNVDSLAVNLDSASELRRLALGYISYCRLISTNPIRLSSLIMPFSREVPQNITASSMSCASLTAALHMLPNLQSLIWPTDVENFPYVSMLKFPRTVTVSLVDDHSCPYVDWISTHILLNRCTSERRPAQLQVVQESAFFSLSDRYDEGLLLRLMRESIDVSQFKWSSIHISRDDQCQAFQHILESHQPINWSRIISGSTHIDALEYLLSQRPEFATCSFGEERCTLLHAICSSMREDGNLDLCRCLLRHGADASAQTTQGKTPLEFFPRLREVIQADS